MSNVVKYSVAQAFNFADVPDSFKVIGYNPDPNDPFVPKKDDHYVFRRDLAREMIAFLNAPSGDALYLSGPTGSGKTSLAVEVLARLNWPMQRVTANGRMEMSDFVGHHALKCSAPGEAPSMQFIYGPLALAMMFGQVLLVNEVDMLEPSVLAGLNDVLEGQPLVIAENGGEVITPDPMFRVIVTGNSTGGGDATGLYQGVQMQNIASMDRFRFSVVPYTSSEVEMDILKRKVPGMAPAISESMIKLANAARKLYTGDDDSAGQISLTMSTRTLVRWAKLTTQFKGAESPLSYGLDLALLNRANPTDRVVVRRLAKDIFGDDFGG